MTQSEYKPTVGLYPHNNVTTQELDAVKQELQQIKRLLATVAERLAIRAA